MAINVEIYEDSGAIYNGNRGTLRTSVNNIGYKNTPEAENAVQYPLSPIGRPLTSGLSFSCQKYNFLKWSGTYTKVSRPRIVITNNIDEIVSGYTCTTIKTRLYYKLTNMYNPADSNIDGSLIYVPTGQTITVYPRTSTTGPEAATSYSQYYNANTTYYTEYLVTKLVVEYTGNDLDFGNLGSLKFKFVVDEYDEVIL